MLNLPKVTLILASGLGYEMEGNVHALKESQKLVNFGAVKYIQDASITDIVSWNKFIIKDLYKYVETTHALLIHPDGFVVNADVWDKEWLGLDYIGSPWPLPQDDYSYRTPSGRLIRVGNSVSLRSKRLMELTATRNMEFHYENNNEDGEICVWQRDWLEEQGCKFGSFEQALRFGKEHELPENMGINTFVFHTVD